MSWIDIGKRLGISDTRVVQLHNAAIRKLRNALRRDEALNRSLADQMDFEPVEGPLESERTRK